MASRKALVRRKGALRFTANVLSQSSTVVSSMVFHGLVAALLKIVSILPYSSRTWAFSMSISWGSARSAWIVRTSPPFEVMISSAISSSEPVRATEITLAPSNAYATATGRPNPRPEPVTSATFPSSLLNA